MELQLGLKITHTRNDLTSIADFWITKDPFAPLFMSRETDTVFLLIAHLRGFGRENIDIGINKEGNKIGISGKRPVQEFELMGWIVQKKEVEIRAFRKIFIIPDEVALDKIKANFDDETSTLTIKMPKLVKGFISGTGIEEVNDESESHLEDEEKIDDKDLREEETTEKKTSEDNDSASQRINLGEKTIDDKVPGEEYTKEEEVSEREKEFSEPRSGEGKLVLDEFSQKDDIRIVTMKKNSEENDSAIQKVDLGEDTVDDKVSGEEETNEEAILDREKEFGEQQSGEGNLVLEEFSEKEKISGVTEKKKSEEIDSAAQRVDKGVETTDDKVPREEDTKEDEILTRKREFYDGKSGKGKVVAEELPEKDEISGETEKEKAEEIDTSSQKVDKDDPNSNTLQNAAEIGSSKEDNKVEGKLEGTAGEREHRNIVESKEEPDREIGGSTITETLEPEENGTREKSSPEDREDGTERIKSTKSGKDGWVQSADQIEDKNNTSYNDKTETVEDEVLQKQDLLKETGDNKESSKPETHQEPNHDKETQLVDHQQRSEDEESVCEETGEKANGQENIPEDKAAEAQAAEEIKEQKPKKSRKLCGPLVVAGSAILATLIALIFHFVRSKKRSTVIAV